MDRLILPEPTSEVPIRVEPGGPARGELVLRNAMHTMPVAFRLQPATRSSPPRYTVRPHTGILAPLASVTVELTYLPTILPTAVATASDNDVFLLHSVVAPGAAAAGAANPEWFTAKRKQVFVDSSIRVFFVGSVVLCRLVAAGTIEPLRDALDRSDPSWRPADAADEAGRTLLDLAISLGRPDLVQILLEFGADPSKPSRGRTPLEVAAAAGETLISELLLANGAGVACGDALHLAAAAGNVEVMKLLLGKAGVSPNAVGKDGKTALQVACEAGRRDSAKVLLAAGAKAEARCGADGVTALHATARRGDEAIARLLLRHGAAGTSAVRDGAGKTAFEVAAEEGHGGRILDLLGLGEALLAAARKGEARAANRAAEGGAGLEGRDAHGWTALMRAAFKGRTEIARDLLSRGADLEAREGEGYTALHCAAEAGKAEMVEMLLKSGANAGAKTAKGMTAAELAAAGGKRKVVRIVEKVTIGKKETVKEKATTKSGSLDRRKAKSGGRKEGFEFESATPAIGWSHQLSLEPPMSL